MISEKQIKKWAEEQLKDTDQFVVYVKVSTDNAINVVIDGDTGVSISDCIALSRHIEHQLDRDEEDFELKVLSSGLEYPFSMLRQYKKYIGKRIQLKLENGSEKKGVLQEANNEYIILQEETEKKYKKTIKRITGESVRISMNEIRQAKAVIEF
jgi:ribosome maturation factor RimP